MVVYRTPGVYFETRDNSGRPVVSARGDVTGFVGVARRGPLHRPVPVESWNQFLSRFGGHSPAGYLAQAVRGFFDNGGKTCWIVRVADPNLARPATVDLLDRDGRLAFRLVAAHRAEGVDPAQFDPGAEDAPKIDLDPGTWGNRLVATLRLASERKKPVPRQAAVPDPDPKEAIGEVKVYSIATQELLSASSGEDQDRTMVRLYDLTLSYADGPTEEYRRLSLDPADPSYIVRVLKGGPIPPGRDVRGQHAVPSDPVIGSRLARAIDLRAAGDRHGGTILMRDGSGGRVTRASFGFRGGIDGLAPAHVITHDQGEGVLRFSAAVGTVEDTAVAVEIEAETNDRFTLRVSSRGQEDASKKEAWLGLSLRTDDTRYVESVVNDPVSGSRLVRVADVRSDRSSTSRFPWAEAVATPGCGTARALSATGVLTGGLSLAHLTGIGGPSSSPWGLEALESISSVSLIAIPDLLTADLDAPPSRPSRPADGRYFDDRDDPATATAITESAGIEYPPKFSRETVVQGQHAMVSHCERVAYRMALLDAPSGGSMSFEELRDWVGSFDTSRAAAYYPWVRVRDPFARGDGLLRIPPSGHVAGIHARSDARIGIHKPPANEVLEGVLDLTARVDAQLHGDLNEIGVNVMRALPGRGLRLLGARTLGVDGALRFVNVRRLLTMIEKSIDVSTQWLTFEPNVPGLWQQVEREVRAYLHTLWQAGMVDGATPDDAFFARCDATTNPPEESALGRLFCLIGVRPPPPAEIVVVRVGRADDGGLLIDEGPGQSMLESSLFS